MSEKMFELREFRVIGGKLHAKRLLVYLKQIVLTELSEFELSEFDCISYYLVFRTMGNTIIYSLTIFIAAVVVVVAVAVESGLQSLDEKGAYCFLSQQTKRECYFSRAQQIFTRLNEARAIDF